MSGPSLLVVGINHRSVSVDLLERLAIGEEQLDKALKQLVDYEHVSEGLVLSTCNRIEVYAAVTRFHGGAQDVRNFLAEFCHVAPEDFVDHLYTFHDDAAARHLFRVASGIDSMIVGESEILGQVRRAYEAARREGATGRLLHAVMDAALHTGKRARTETGIGRAPASVSSAAVELARRALGSSLEGRSVVVLGAGEVAELATKALHAAGATGVVVVNRSPDRASELASRFGGRAAGFSQLVGELARADIVLSSTAAPSPVVSAAAVASAMATRPDRPLLLIDIAVPRDVDPAAAEISNVHLRDIDDLGSVVETSVGTRVAELGRVEEIISEELQAFTARARSDQIAPLVASLLRRAEDLRRAELERAGTALTPEQREELDRMSAKLVAKLLHEPVTRLKELAARPDGAAYADTFAELFGIDDLDA